MMCVTVSPRSITFTHSAHPPPPSQHHKGERLVFHPKKIKTWEQFLAACAIVKGFTGAIRKVVTPDGHRLTSTDELQGTCAA